MDAAYVSALSALAGSSIGAFATFATTWLNQSYQNRIQRRSNEASRRERAFGDFIDEASQAYSDAMINPLTDPTRLVKLYSIKSRISLFAGTDVVQAAEEVIDHILQRYYSQKIDYAKVDIDRRSHFDLLAKFTEASRKELVRY